MSGVIDHDSMGGSLHQRQHGEEDNKDKKNQRDETYCQQSPQHGYHTQQLQSSIQEVQTTLNHNSTIVRRQKELVGQLRLLAPEAEQSRAEQILVYHLCHHLT